MARREGITLNEFKLEDFGVPYGYSPVLLTAKDTLERDPEMVEAFLRAVENGYLYAAENPVSMLLCNKCHQLDIEEIAEMWTYVG